MVPEMGIDCFGYGLWIRASSLTQKEMAKIGVTPNKGGVIPLYILLEPVSDRSAFRFMTC